ncbi:MAG: fibronectin type III domain-containing protein [Propionibacteriaceae bacterium]|nr:fibronectin type III domain-containing protein [Propionibacteriaceae bacterium]
MSFVAKFGADGSQKWLNNYGFVSSYDVLSSVAVKADGSGVAVGKFDGKSAVVKFGANGSQAWRKTGYSDSNNGLNGRWESVALASDASIVAIGQLDGVSKVVKLGADGSQKWIKSIDSADAILAAVAVAADGSVVVTGATPSTNFVAKYGSNGSQAWLKSVTSDDSSLVSVAVAADGSIVTAGPGTQVGKRGSDGTMKWAKAYELTLRGNEYIGAVALAPGGGIVLGGSFGDAFQTGQVAKLVDPALMPRITSAAVSPAVWSGKAVCPKVSVKAGSSVVPASGYSVSGCGTNIGKYTVTVTGKAGFAGSVRVASQVVPQTVKISKAAAGKKKATVSWTKANAKQKITKYQVAYRLKGASAWKVKTTKASAKSLAVKSLKKKKSYEFRVRAYKTVAKVNYYGGWSAIKTAKVK